MKALRGLRGQLGLAFAVVFGLVVGLAGLYQYRQVGRVLHQGDELRLRARAEALLSRVEVSGAVPVVPLPVRGERIRVVVEATGQPARELFHSPGFGTSAFEDKREKMSLVEVRQAATDYTGRRVQVRLWLARSAAPLLADLGRVRLGLWGALVGSLVLAAALAALLGWWVLRPLRRISRQARRIGAAPGPEFSIVN